MNYEGRNYVGLSTSPWLANERTLLVSALPDILRVAALARLAHHSKSLACHICHTYELGLVKCVHELVFHEWNAGAPNSRQSSRIWAAFLSTSVANYTSSGCTTYA